MFNAPDLTAKTKQSLSDQIGKILSNMPKAIEPETSGNLGPLVDGFGGGPPLLPLSNKAVGVSLPIEVLGLDSIAAIKNNSQISDLRTMSKLTGGWHHQIVNTGTPDSPITSIVGYAESTIDDNTLDEHRIRGVFGASLAIRVHETIDWIKTQSLVDSDIRLLVIPAFQLYAISLCSSGVTRLVLVDRSPETFGLEFRHVYTSSEFLLKLSQNAPITGLDL